MLRSFIALVIIWILFIVGWVANIIQVISSIPATFGEMTPMFAIKCISIFIAPLGSVLGWVGMFG